MTNIGLRRGAVELVSYNPKWPQLFEEEKAKLLSVFGDKILAVEHIGSTAVPGLAAKPLIDMMVAIPKLAEYKEYVQNLQELGYEFMPERVFSDRVFLPKGPRDNRTHHLNLVEMNSEQWNTSLKFRDYLRKHEQKRDEYQKLKEKLAKRYPDNREIYTKAKSQFIQEVLSYKSEAAN